MPSKSPLIEYDTPNAIKARRAAAIDRFVRLNEKNMMTAAMRFQGRVRYASQHPMIRWYLDLMDRRLGLPYKQVGLTCPYAPPPDWVSPLRDVISRGSLSWGLAIQWICYNLSSYEEGFDHIESMYAKKVIDVIYFVQHAKNCGINSIANGLGRHIVDMQIAGDADRDAKRDRELSRSFYVRVKKFKLSYPFTNLHNVMINRSDEKNFGDSSGRLRRFYFIESGMHAMAASVHPGTRKVIFYDPDIGMVSDLRSPDFFPIYLRGRIDAMRAVLNHEKSLGCVEYLGWSKNVADCRLVVTEYKDNASYDFIHGRLRPKRIKNALAMAKQKAAARDPGKEALKLYAQKSALVTSGNNDDSKYNDDNKDNDE